MGCGKNNYIFILVFFCSIAIIAIIASRQTLRRAYTQHPKVLSYDIPQWTVGEWWIEEIGTLNEIAATPHPEWDVRHRKYTVEAITEIEGYAAYKVSEALYYGDKAQSPFRYDYFSKDDLSLIKTDLVGMPRGGIELQNPGQPSWSHFIYGWPLFPLVDGKITDGNPDSLHFKRKDGTIFELAENMQFFRNAYRPRQYYPRQDVVSEAVTWENKKFDVFRVQFRSLDKNGDISAFGISRWIPGIGWPIQGWSRNAWSRLVSSSQKLSIKPPPPKVNAYQVTEGDPLPIPISKLEEIASPQKIILQTPRWKIHDWFEINVSTWHEKAIKITDDELDWEKPYRLRYEVIEESLCYGYPCYVLQEYLLNEGQRKSADRFFFRKTDMMLIAVWSATTKDKLKPTWMKQFGTAPWIIKQLGLVPRFPLFEGELPIHWIPMMDANNMPIKSSTEEETSYVFTDTLQVSNETYISQGEKLHAVISILCMGYACYWAPGQIWWLQCWERPISILGPDGLYKRGGSHYRASLYATSRDGVVDFPLPKAANGGEILSQ